MKNIAIVCDSSVALTENQVNEQGIYIAPLSIIYNNKEYLDQIEMSREKVTKLLKDNALLKTSQPNLGVIIKLLEEVKEKEYDHVFILSLSSALSGTHSTFKSGIDQVDLKNYSLIDSMTLCGPVQESIKVIHKLNKEGASPKQIETYLNDVYFMHTEFYVYPQTLEQLKRSGRISKGAALLASMLRVKPLLKLSNHAEAIDKFKTTRTEQKIIEEIIKDLKANNINPKEHVIYLLQLKRKDIIDEVKKRLTDEIGKFDIFVTDLPAALGTHAGIGTLAVQWAKKANTVQIDV